MAAPKCLRRTELFVPSPAPNPDLGSEPPHPRAIAPHGSGYPTSSISADHDTCTAPFREFAVGHFS